MKKRLKPVVKRLAIQFLCGYGLLVLVVFLLQRSLIYYPNVQRPELPSTLTLWPSKDDYRGFVGAGGVSRPTVVVFHGNAGRAADRVPYVRALEKLGYRVILAEFPGYGGRPGELSEASFVADGKRIVRLVAEQAKGPVIVFGESLGCGVVAALAADPNLPIRGLVLITPWDSLAEVAQEQYWFLPSRWMVQDRFDSVANLKNTQSPIAVLLAEHDEVIPTSHGQRLYDSLTAPKKRWVFPGAGHNTWPRGPKEAWWQEVMAFVQITSAP